MRIHPRQKIHAPPIAIINMRERAPTYNDQPIRLIGNCFLNLSVLVAHWPAALIKYF